MEFETITQICNLKEGDFMKFKTRFNKLIAWVLTLAMLMTFLSSLSLVVSAAEGTNVNPYKQMLELIVPENNYGVGNFPENRIFHAWGWSYQNAKAKLEAIAEQGFSTILVSPPNEIKMPTKYVKFHEPETDGISPNGWWMLYQPAGFQLNESFDNALGTKSEFIELCEAAHGLGLKIMVEAVVGYVGTDDDHVGEYDNVSNAPMDHVSSRVAEFEPEIITEQAFHFPWINSAYKDKYWDGWSDFDIEESLTQQAIDGKPDLATETQLVQDAIFDYFTELTEAGADGFYFNDAKHIETASDTYFASDFWDDTLGKIREQYPHKNLQAVAEIIDGSGDGRGAEEYLQYGMNLTHTAMSDTIRDSVINGTDITYAFDASLPQENSVLWSESYKSYAKGETSALTSGQRAKMWALAVSRKGVKGIYLARPSDELAEGQSEVNNILSTITLGEANVTDWSTDVVKNINNFAGFFADTDESVHYDNGISVIERDKKGAVLVNMQGGETAVSLSKNTLLEGEYTDAITGNKFTVENGEISGEIGESGIAVLYLSEIAEGTFDVTPEVHWGTSADNLTNSGTWEEFSLALGYYYHHGVNEVSYAKVAGDITLTNSINVQKNLTVDMAGFNITYNSIIFTGQPESTLTIIDSVGGSELTTTSTAVIYSKGNTTISDNVTFSAESAEIVYYSGMLDLSGWDNADGIRIMSNTDGVIVSDDTIRLPEGYYMLDNQGKVAGSLTSWKRYTVGIPVESGDDKEPVINSITFNTDSPAYDAATGTFYIDEAHPLIITVTGENLSDEMLDLVLCNSDYHGFTMPYRAGDNEVVEIEFPLSLYRTFIQECNNYGYAANLTLFAVVTMNQSFNLSDTVAFPVVEADTITYPVWVCGKQFTNKMLTVNDENGGTATYNPDSNTLTLSNMNITSGYKDDNERVIGVYADSDLNIELTGENNITMPDDNNKSYGIRVKGDLSVSGSGSLTAVAGNVAANDSADRYSTGIYTGGQLNISNANVYARGGDVFAEAEAYSSGVYSGGGLEVDFGGSLTAVGGKANGSMAYSTGLEVLGNEEYINISVYDGNIIAKGGDAEGVIVAESNGAYLELAGFYVYENTANVELTSGNAKVTSADESNKPYACSNGITVYEGDIAIHGGTVDIFGGTWEGIAGDGWAAYVIGEEDEDGVVSGGNVLIDWQTIEPSPSGFGFAGPRVTITSTDEEKGAVLAGTGLVIDNKLIISEPEGGKTTTIEEENHKFNTILNADDSLAKNVVIEPLIYSVKIEGTPHVMSVLVPCGMSINEAYKEMLKKAGLTDFSEMINTDKDGYNFNGFYTESKEKFDFDDSVISDMTITGKWTKKSSGGGGSSGSSTTTTKNEDGSTTKTTTNKITGTVTKITTYGDGSTIKVETKKDGTVTTTEKDKDGNTTTTVQKPDGTTVTTVKDTNGTKTVTTKNTDGTAVVNKAAKKEFADVHPVNHWATADVDYAYTGGLMLGTSETHFSPDIPLTRAMLVTVLYRLEGEPPTNKSIPFADVDMDAYYGNAVSWAKQNGIVKGVSETEFAPDDNITREQIAVIMHRYAQFKGIAPTGAWAIRLDYTDLAQISDYAVEGVMYCTMKGIMQGKGNKIFAPKDNAARAEAAAILHRFTKANK